MATRRDGLAERRKVVGLSQERLAGMLGVERSTVVRWESARTEPQPWVRPKLAKALGLTLDQIGELISAHRERALLAAQAATGQAAADRPRPDHPSGADAPDPPEDRSDTTAPSLPGPDAAAAGTHRSRPLAPDFPYPTLIPVRRRCGIRTSEDDRRELARMTGTAGAFIAAGAMDDGGEIERPRPVGSGAGVVGVDLDEHYEDRNAQLWRVYAGSTVKSGAWPLVRGQLQSLVAALGEPLRESVHQELCRSAADLFQLAGEIMFDENHAREAIQAYTLAASAAREARAFDLWAAALTRHAYVHLYDAHFRDAELVLGKAARLARHGDPALATRFWISAAIAQARAGLGDLAGTDRALDHATRVQELTGESQNGGWLRYDASRLPEDRGRCYVALRRPDLSQPRLDEALRRRLTPRRSAGVLIDLALTGVYRHDPDQVLAFSDLAMQHARRTNSGWIGRRLAGLRSELGRLPADGRLQQLDEDLADFVEELAGDDPDG